MRKAKYMNKGRYLRMSNRGIHKRFQDGSYKIVSPPYRYIYNKGNIEIDADKAQVVRKIFNWVLEGISGYAITRKLNEAGISSPRGKKWNADSGLS